jgi:hypothetical protein
MIDVVVPTVVVLVAVMVTVDVDEIVSSSTIISVLDTPSSVNIM